MLWLPDVKNLGCRLPLADFSAAALLSAKAASGESALSAVRGAFEQDAAFSLWAVCRSAADGQTDLYTCDALARWLVANQRRALVWPDGIHETPNAPAWRERYRWLAAVSLAVARRAERLAGGTGELAQRALMLGLSHLAHEWRGLDGERRADGAPLALPNWLSAALGELFGTASNPDMEAVRCVARARRECDETTALADYDRLTSAGELTAAALASAARCLARSDGEFEFERRLTAAKLAALAEFAAGAGHEINNPIAVICGRAQLLLEGESNPQKRHELAVINSQAMRVYEMISDMMLFARPPEPKLATCDVAAAARQVVEELTPKACDRQVTLRFDESGDPLKVEADAAQLAVVIRALCDNALTSVPRGGHVIDRGERRSAAGEPCAILLTVTDDGPGMTERVREHLFDPFFSGREAGRGLGMGLAKAWSIVQRHGGRIEVQSKLGAGGTFTVVLPATPTAAPSKARGTH